MGIRLTETCVLDPPSTDAWISAIGVHLSLAIFLQVPIGVCLYYVIRHEPPLKKSFALSLGILAASLMMVTPFDSFNHPWMASFLASSAGFSIFFKCVAVAFDQLPPEVNLSLFNHVYSTVALPEPIFAKGKFLQASLYERVARLKYFCFKIVGLCLLLSVLDKLKRRPAFNDTESSIYLVLLRGFLHVWFVYLFISFCLDFGALATSGMTGVSAQPGFRNPLFESRSLREAWGTRWNLPVHTLLKRSVYIPARKAGFGRAAASIAAFVVSGLLHEYTFAIHNAEFYEPGKATLFFILMGCVVLAEDWIHTSCSFLIPSWTKHVPSPLICMFLVLCVAAGPIEPLFIKSWVEAGAIEAVTELLPVVICND